MCVWRQGFNLALDEVKTSLPREFDEVETSLPREFDEVETSLPWCVVWRQGFNLALGEVETSLPREVVTRLKVRFLGVLFGGEVLTLPCIANHAKIKHEKI